MKFNEIIVRETPNMRIHIYLDNPDNCLYQNLRIREKNDIPATLYGYDYDPSMGFIDVGYYEGSVSGCYIESPFNLVISLKTPLEKWNDPKYNGSHEFMDIIQNEIDKVFKLDARKAALIIDQKSYDDTPERYMLVPLMNSEPLRKRYDTTPLLKYGNGHQYLSDIPTFNRKYGPSRDLLFMLADHQNMDFYCMNNGRIESIQGQILDNDGTLYEDVEYGRINTKSQVTNLATWGLYGKRRPSEIAVS